MKVLEVVKRAALIKKRVPIRRTSFSIVLSVFAIQATQLAHALTNPGFETPYAAVPPGPATLSGNIANGWFDNSVSGTIAYAQDTAAPHGGTSDQQITIGATSPGWQMAQTVAVTAGHTYLGSLWVKGSGGTVSYYLRQAGSPYTTYGSASVVPTGSWQQISFVCTSPVTASVFLMVKNGGSAGTVSTDDAVLQDVTANTGKTIGVKASDDVFVWDGDPTHNRLGDLNTYTCIGATGANREVYLKFPVSSALSNATSAIVWLDGMNRGTAPYSAPDSLYSVSNSWTESTITWNTRPTVTAGALSSCNITTNYLQYYWDVTSDLASKLAGSQTAVSYDLKMAGPPSNSAVNNYTSMHVSGTPIPPVLAAMIGNTPSYAPISSTLFGIHTHSSAHWPTVSSGTIRMWDSGTTWPNIEPNAPVGGVHTYVWTTLDAYVAAAAAHGQEVILTLGLTPSWATSNPAHAPYGTNYCTSPPTDIANWTAYVTAVANRYKTGSTFGRIKFFEVWNEPDLTSFFNGTNADLVNLAHYAHDAVKGVDSTDMMLTPSFEGGFKGLTSTVGLSGYLTAGGGAYADIATYHFYVNAKGPESIVPLVVSIRNLLASAGYSNLPLWDTESGYFQGPSDPAWPANVVARTYLVDTALGIGRSCYYAWDQTSGELVLLQSSLGPPVVLSASGVAYNTVANWLVGANLTFRGVDNNGTWLLQIMRNGIYKGNILWNPNTSMSFSIPSSWGITKKRDITNTTTSMVGVTTVTVGASPVILENS